MIIGKRRAIPWRSPWIIDLDDHEASGIRDFTRYHANGEREEVMSAVMDGIGPHGLYNLTDTIMCKMPTGSPRRRPPK